MKKHITIICTIIIVVIMLALSVVSDPLFWRQIDQTVTPTHHTPLSTTIKQK